MSPGTGKQVFIGDTLGDGVNSGSAINEKESSGAQFTHQPAHRHRIPGQQTSHVIIHPGHMGNGGDIALQGLDELLSRHTLRQSTITQTIALVGLHGLMQHDLFMQCVGLARQLLGKGGLREKGVCHRTRQGQGMLSRNFLVAQIIDNQGNFDRTR